MTWFSRKPSTTDRLIDALAEERAARLESDRLHAEALQQIVTAIAAQSNVTREWLGLLKTSSVPEVRVMTAMDEVAYDAARHRDAPQTAPAAVFSPEQMLADLQGDFARIKSEFAV